MSETPRTPSASLAFAQRIDRLNAAIGRAAAWACLFVVVVQFAVVVLAWFAWPYVARSWRILEASRETSGIPAVFLLKTLIPAFALLMALQGVSQAIKAAAVLCRKGAP